MGDSPDGWPTSWQHRPIIRHPHMVSPGVVAKNGGQTICSPFNRATSRITYHSRVSSPGLFCGGANWKTAASVNRSHLQTLKNRTHSQRSYGGALLDHADSG